MLSNAERLHNKWLNRRAPKMDERLNNRGPANPADDAPGRSRGMMAAQVVERPDMAPGRRIGAPASKTRALVLDAAEQLMLEEGYASVTSRRVSARAGISGPLVHYYFRTMDDLLLEVFRRRADEGLTRFTAAMDSDGSLRSIWEFRTAGHAFDIEFAALANHRKAIRADLAWYAARFREMQLDALEKALAREGISASDYPAPVVRLIVSGITQMIELEKSLGLASDHAVAVQFVERWIDALTSRQPGNDPTAVHLR